MSYDDYISNELCNFSVFYSFVKPSAQHVQSRKEKRAIAPPFHVPGNHKHLGISRQ